MKESFIPGRFEISVKVDGRIYSGYYTEDKRNIVVYFNCHFRSVHKIGNGINDFFAKTILMEMVKEYGCD